MSKHQNDISQIRKYINGELDARAMHRLERQALDDPFLSDALEGYQHAGKNQQNNLADLSARLQSRVDEKVKRLIPWGPLSIAASILVVIGVSMWLMTRNSNDSAPIKQVAANVKPTQKKEQPVISSPSVIVPAGRTDSAPVIVKTNRLKVSRPAAVTENDDVATNPQATADVSPPALSEIQTNAPINANSTQWSATPKLDTSLFVAKAKAPASANGLFQTDKLTNNSNNAIKPQDQYKANAYGNTNQAVVPDQNAAFKSTPQITDALKKTSNNQPSLLQSKVDGIDVKPANKSLAGTVTNLAGTPLAGAVVKVAGNNFGVVTDENGHFIIHDVPEKKNLTVGYLGYDTKQVSLNADDSVNIALTPTQRILKEAETGSMASKRSTDAHPTAGWKTLNTYLDKNAVLPDGQTGKVYLSFTVDAKGSLSNFTVLKSLNTTADQKAIDLLTKGPTWVGAADGQAHEVKLMVEFK